MNFTPSRSEVSPLPTTLPESHRAMPPPSPPPPWPPRPSRTPGRPDAQGPAPRAPLAASPPPLHTPHPTPTLLQHIPTFYLKSKATHPLPDSPLFLWRTLPYTLLPMMNTVYCVCFKEVYLIAPFFLSLLLTSPMPAFSLGFLGGNDEHMNFFSHFSNSLF